MSDGAEFELALHPAEAMLVRDARQHGSDAHASRQNWQVWPLSAPGPSLLARAVALSNSCTALRSAADMLEALRMATELARTEIGLERVAFYLRAPDPDRIVLRGTWGTGAHGETTDEQALFHELSERDAVRLLRVRATDPPALCRPKALHFATEQGHSTVIGMGWVMVTPLLTEGHLVGVMYNDAALTGSAPDRDKQLLGAMLCSMVAIEHAARVGPLPGRPLGLRLKQNTLAERAKSLIAQDPRLSGKSLARQFEISAGFLAREFKREVGVSLVEYRNRVRIERFQRLARERGGSGYSLRRAAFDCGFGSYAQFNRVHRRLTGAPAKFPLPNERSSSEASPEFKAADTA